MEIKQIKKSYTRKRRLYKTRQNTMWKSLALAEEHISKLQKKYDNMKYPHFIDNYMKPLAEELLKYFPNRTYDILGPFGLTNNTSIHFYKNKIEEKDKFEGDNCISVSFRPINDGDDYDLELVNHLKQTGQYDVGTMGEVNGMNYPTVKMPDTIKELVKFIKEQNKNGR